MCAVNKKITQVCELEQGVLHHSWMDSPILETL